jgi:putative Mg2+ transporter-C (MgtC) family protein
MVGFGRVTTRPYPFGEGVMLTSEGNHLFVSPDDWGHILFRVALAVATGALVGLNRDRGKRPAGLRTDVTVSVGSAQFVMLIPQAGVEINATNALSRTVQAITPGVGFIGAGIIDQQARSKGGEVTQIRGLTSSAALWLTASLGNAAGCGLWRMTLVGKLATLLVLSGFKRIKDAPVSKIRVRRNGRAKLTAAVNRQTTTPPADV